LNIKVTPLAIPEILLIETEFFRDERGFFIESYHRAKYRESGITDDFVQDNHSSSGRGVLRGLHYQDMRSPMAKLVRCTAGVIVDVAVDLRVGSPTFGRYVMDELSAENMRQLYVPVGFAHGFQVLSDQAEVQYKCSTFYDPAAEGAVRWDDAELGIPWPIPNPVLSGKDAAAQTLERYGADPAFP
jgi:dTDP-4-dehydrorhamnose 3,5-epimerase